MTTSRYTDNRNRTFLHNQRSGTPHLGVAQHPSSLATSTWYLSCKAGGISGGLHSGREISSAVESHSSAPSASRSSPAVCWYVPYPPLNLDFPAQPSMAQSEDCADSERRRPPAAAQRFAMHRHGPIPTHILGPLQPSNPIGFGLSTNQHPQTDLLQAAEPATPPSSGSRSSRSCRVGRKFIAHFRAP